MALETSATPENVAELLARVPGSLYSFFCLRGHASKEFATAGGTRKLSFRARAAARVLPLVSTLLRTICSRAPRFPEIRVLKIDIDSYDCALLTAAVIFFI